MIQDPQISGNFLVLRRVFIAKHRLQIILSPSIFGATSPVFELIKVAQNRLNDEKCWGTSQNERRNLLSASWSNKNSIFLERKMLSFLGDGNWDVENAFLASNQPKRVPTKDQQPAPTQLGKLPSPSRFFSRCAMRPCGHTCPPHPHQAWVWLTWSFAFSTAFWLFCAAPGKAFDHFSHGWQVPGKWF